MVKSKFVIIFSAVFFTLLSFVPSIYEYITSKGIPPERYFVFEHNYNFDFNFYLSRIRQGREGQFLVTEKYYNQPHKESLFQIVYLYLGKAGGLLGFSDTNSYHIWRLVFGFLLLYITAIFGKHFFEKKWLYLFFLLAATSGSWPILTTTPGLFRFATWMGWWSVMDSLQRITIMPHILIGQIFLVLFIIKFISGKTVNLTRAIVWGLSGLIAGIIFPPTLIIIYGFFAVQAILELLDIFSLRVEFTLKRKKITDLIKTRIIPEFIFFLLSAPSFIYIQIMFREQPWKALALFDIEHRIPLPYDQYLPGLGPQLILGIAGLVFVIMKNKRKFYPAVSWVLTISLLSLVFDKVPQQSPIRFTEGLIHIPLAVLTTYIFQLSFQAAAATRGKLRQLIRAGAATAAGGVILTGFLVMLSMILWLTDQTKAKQLATWKVPLGAQLGYPVRDFMEGIFYLRDNTARKSVVLSYITAGNYIPAYAGNYVYLGHANTPHEDENEIEAERFYKGEMDLGAARKFLQKERISYIYFGPQERELGEIEDLKAKYNFLIPIYTNNSVKIYRLNI